MIKKKIGTYLNNELFIGSLIIVGLTFLGNLFSYLFQFLGARLLGPIDYGIVAIITSLIAIFSIPSSAIQTVIAKETTTLKVKGKTNKIKGLMYSSIKKVILAALILFIIYSILAIPFSNILKIKYAYLFYTGFFIFAAFLYPVTTGIVQGLKKFSSLGFNFFINCFIKFVVGIGLIVLGLRVYGAITGFLAGMFLAFLLLLYSLRKIFKNKTESYSLNLFSQTNLYPLIAMLLFVLLFNLDVIFAKIFFDAELAGQYSVASLIGKIIIFVVSSIGTVMLPVSSEKHAKGKDSKGILNKTLMLSLIVCLGAVLVFAFFPKMIVGLLFGAKYLSIYPILVYVGLAFSFLALLNIYLFQAIATNKIKIKSIIILLACLLIECIAFKISSANIETFAFGFMISAIISYFGGYIIFKNGKS